MKKFLSLMIILSLSAVLCITSCDQEHGGSGSSGSGGGGEGGENEQIAITSFSIEPDDTDGIIMAVDETMDFTISYAPSNANLFDLTWDVSGDADIISVEIPEKIQETKVITVTAKKEGTATVVVSRIANPSISKAVKLFVTAKSQETEEAADITTLEVTVNVTDITIDNIYLAKLWWGLGNYEAKKESGKSLREALDKETEDFYDGNLEITKSDNKTATIKFKYENNDLSSAFTPYFFIQLKDENDVTVGNLENIYQDNRKYKKKTKYGITVDIKSVYGDAALELN